MKHNTELVLQENVKILSHEQVRELGHSSEHSFKIETLYEGKPGKVFITSGYFCRLSETLLYQYANFIVITVVWFNAFVSFHFLEDAAKIINVFI